MPSFWCRETTTALVFAVILFVRTIMTLVMSSILASFVKSLCNRDWPGIRRIMLTFSVIAIPTAILNAALKFCDQKLSIHLREKVTKKVHELYMTNMNFYKANKVGFLFNAGFSDN